VKLAAVHGPHADVGLSHSGCDKLVVTREVDAVDADVMLAIILREVCMSYLSNVLWKVYIVTLTPGPTPPVLVPSSL
jgi:hypothetical protein